VSAETTRATLICQHEALQFLSQFCTITMVEAGVPVGCGHGREVRAVCVSLEDGNLADSAAQEGASYHPRTDHVPGAFVFIGVSPLIRAGQPSRPRTYPSQLVAAHRLDWSQPIAWNTGSRSYLIDSRRLPLRSCRCRITCRASRWGGSTGVI
jgi:hypothetical protein